ncbi:MAG TPA: histidine phosphatase family protein [Anaerolineales bacterium]|nr:histidine phosphatase family protein [Anaerolineales bacterium]
MTTLYLIRHGETDWNVEGRYQGQADPPLNARGVAQSGELVEALRGERLDALCSSPLDRAAATARILSQALGIPFTTDDRFMEIHQGDWQTRLRAEIESLYPDEFRLWEQRPWETRPPGGETLQQVRDRVHAGADDLVARHPVSRIGLVTHRIPIALLMMRYQDLDPDIIRTLHLPNVFWEGIPVP